MLYILAVIHLANYDSPMPDRYEPLRAYNTLSECWAEAAIRSEEYAYGDTETIVVCLAEQNQPTN